MQREEREGLDDEGEEGTKECWLGQGVDKGCEVISRALGEGRW